MNVIEKLDAEIISKVRYLNGVQKNELLNFIERIPRKKHSSRLYRRKAMKQIRQALEKQ